MSYTYLKPSINCTVKFFAKDEKTNKHRKWKSPQYLNRGEGKETDGRHALQVSGDDSLDGCRETLCYSYADILQSVKPPDNSYLTLDPPRNRLGNPLVKDTALIELGFQFVISKHSDFQDLPQETLIVLKDLLSSSARQKKLYALMDAILGSIAMLVAGPKAYTRKRRNPTKSSIKVRQYREEDERLGKDGRWRFRMVSVRSYNGSLSYNGVSNFFMAHSALLSLITGMARFCLEVWVDGLYDKVDYWLDIEGCRNILADYRKQKQLNEKQRDFLLDILKTFVKKFLYSKKVENNIGAYPLNKYTWPMFGRLLEGGFSFDRIDPEQWGRVKSGPYSYRAGGFHSWCETHKKKTASLKKCPKNLSGTKGTQLMVGGGNY